MRYFLLLFTITAYAATTELEHLHEGAQLVLLKPTKIYLPAAIYQGIGLQVTGKSKDATWSQTFGDAFTYSDNAAPDTCIVIANRSFDLQPGPLPIQSSFVQDAFRGQLDFLMDLVSTDDKVLILNTEVGQWQCRLRAEEAQTLDQFNEVFQNQLKIQDGSLLPALGPPPSAGTGN